MANLEKKLSKAYEKVGSKIGKKYEIYSPISYEIGVFDSINWITTVKVALTQSDFKQSKTEGLQFYDVYSSFSAVDIGSIIFDRETGRMFNITNHEENHGINAIECYNTITIYKTVSSYDGTQPVDTVLAKDLPCSLLISGEDTASGAIAQSRPSPAFKVSSTIRFQSVRKLNVEIGDKLIDNDGNQYEVITLEYTSTGYKLICNGIRP